VGAQLYQPALEEIGLNANLDRLADLLASQELDRIDAFWSAAMAKQDLGDANTISGQLKRAIVASGLTHYAIGKAAGVDPGIILRFMSGERETLKLATVDRLAVALGLRLCQDRDDAK
jgi:hypothetical protein